MEAYNKKTAGLLIAFFSISLTGGYSAKAEEISLDSISGAAGLSESLKGRPEPEKAPVPAPAPATTSEMVGFWEKLTADTANSICKNSDLKLTKEARLPTGAAGITGGIKRYLRSYPNRKLALVDQVNIKLDAAIGHEVLNIPGISASIGVSVGGSLEGQAIVVRPLESDRYCKELATLVKLYEMKTVVPVSASRLASMEVGEIWKLPLIVRYGFGGSIGSNIPEVLSISVSAGWGKEVKPSVSLYRMDESNLRLRLRLDRVTVISYGLSASTFEIPVGDIGLWKAENALAGRVNDRWAKEINKYIAFKLSYGHSNSSGKQLLVEMILNPRNSEQMDRLVEFLKGDLGIVKRFVELGVKLGDFTEEDNSERGFEMIQSAAGPVGSKLGADSSYAGSNVFRGQSDSFRIQVPIIHTHDIGRSSTYNRYQTLGKNGEILHVQQESRVSNGNTFNIPLVGTLMKYNSQKNVYVINKERSNGSVTRPAFLYQQYEGFARESDLGARYMIDKANGVLRYVGVAGNGTDESNVLPSSSIFPEPPIDPNADIHAPAPTKLYRAALMSFKVLLNERGVQGIVFAPAQAIMKAFLNMMRETESVIIDKVGSLFTIDTKGKVDYDYGKAREILDSPFSGGADGGTNPLDIVRTLAYTATRVIADIAGVRDAGNWKDQSARLAKVAAGSSRSGLGYEDFLKIIVQLIEPGDISAELYVHTDKRVKGEPDVTQNYQFFNTRDNKFDSTINEVNQVRERFAQPAELTD